MALPFRKNKETPLPSPRRRERTYEVSATGAIVYVGIVAVLVLLLWSAWRERESHVRVPDLAGFEEVLPSIAGLTGSPILDGNRVQVLQDGDGFFPVLFADIDGTRESIHLETYVWWK
ncbi:MAG: hypothetical protein ACLGI9_15545, partial [Thermoanaerobaculia bacterium]